eukprot:scaffold29871_cov40-Cyclotella_meneghiniana.AAC.2
MFTEGVLNTNVSLLVTTDLELNVAVFHHLTSRTLLAEFWTRTELVFFCRVSGSIANFHFYSPVGEGRETLVFGDKYHPNWRTTHNKSVCASIYGEWDNAFARAESSLPAKREIACHNRMTAETDSSHSSFRLRSLLTDDTLA